MRRRILLNSAYFDKSKAAGYRRYRGLGSARPLYGKILRQTGHHFHCKELADYTGWENILNPETPTSYPVTTTRLDSLGET